LKRAIGLEPSQLPIPATRVCLSFTPVESSPVTSDYHHRLSRREVLDEELVAFIRKTVLPKVCSNTDMRDGIDKYGVTYRYSYLFPDSNAPVAVNIDAAACAGQ
jgi:hypothetical protein